MVFIAVWETPRCEYCGLLKAYLIERGLKFQTHTFDDFIQLTLIMRNVFGNPPILDVDGMRILLTQEHMFYDGELIEFVVDSAVEGKNLFKGAVVPCMFSAPTQLLGHGVKNCEECPSFVFCTKIAEDFRTGFSRWFYVGEDWVLLPRVEGTIWGFLGRTGFGGSMKLLQDIFNNPNTFNFLQEFGGHEVLDAVYFSEKFPKRSGKQVYKALKILEDSQLIIKLPLEYKPDSNKVMPVRWRLNI